MPTPRRVFISYCHEDIDHENLEFLLHLFEINALGDYQVLIDRVNLHYGDSIKDFMSLLKIVDSVVLLLTPAYKRKVLSHSGGVYTEYKQIMLRYEESEYTRPTAASARPVTRPSFELIPVIFTGDPATSLPDEVSHLRYLSLVGLRVARDDHRRFMVTKYAQQKFVPEILRIIGNWRVTSSLKSSEFKRQYNDLYTRLFRELKSNWQEATQGDLAILDNLFVKTDAYRQIQKQDVYFIIGRKGSGKSTITEVISIQLKDQYKGFVPLIANDFELESLYALLGSRQIESDTTNVVSRNRVFSFAWELLFYICCIQILTGLHKLGKLTQEQAEHAESLVAYIDSLSYASADGGATSAVIPSHFWYAFSTAVSYVKKVIDEAVPNETQYYAEIRSRMSREAFLNFAIGEAVLSAFTEIVKTCKRKFLITLDGFDIKFDEFRHNSLTKYPEELKFRAEFEIEWLSALLLTILDIKQEKRRSRFYDALDFCITVPKDRYLEARRSVRDSYRYIGRSCSLDWTGIELAILVRKRLEMLCGFSTDPDTEVKDRLLEVHRQCFSTIPYEVPFEYHGHDYRLTLFAYILRHTFWRPREVLLHYAKILAVSENMRRQAITVEMIRRIVKEVNFEIIQNEFIQEFRSVVSNIEEIVQAFSRAKHFLTYPEVSARVAAVNFDFVIGQLGVDDVDRKIDFLYDIGFLGVFVDEEQREQLGITHKHAFYFNEGQAIKKIGGKDKFADSRFLIHPIFVEYLRLDVSSGELVLSFDWDYLRQNEAMRQARTA